MLIRQLRQLPVAPWSVTPSTGTPFGLEMRPEGKHGRRELDELEAIRLIGPSATSAPLLTPLCGQFFRYTEITFLIRDFFSGCWNSILFNKAEPTETCKCATSTRTPSRRPCWPRWRAAATKGCSR